MAKSSKISSNLIPQIYKSRKTILSLLKTQGYNVDDYSEFSNNEVHVMTMNEQLDMLIERKDSSEDYEDLALNQDKKVYVKYHMSKTLRQNNIEELIDDLFNIEQVLTKKDDLIMIIKDEPHEPIIEALKHIWETQGIFVTIFGLKRLQFNILEHSLVFPHRILNKRDEKAIRQKYFITDDEQLPEISRFDAVAMAIGLRPGDVCEITRSSKTAMETKFYRLCYNKM